MIPDEQVEEVRARADIVGVIGEFVSLKKAGREFRALCPFHEERTPSFYVVPEKGFYKCFGCGESGDVFSFLSKQRGLSFVDAIRHVAARSGVELREVQGRRPEDDPLRPLREAVAFAREYASTWSTGGSLPRPSSGSTSGSRHRVDRRFVTRPGATGSTMRSSSRSG
jgi:DNA primase